MSSTGTPDPVMIREVVDVVHYVFRLARDGDTGHAGQASAIVQALAVLRNDLTEDGSQSLETALHDWSEYYGWSRFHDSTSWLTPGLLAWLDDDEPVIASIVRRLLTHLTAYRARTSCGPRRVDVWNYDGSGRSRVRPYRRSRWDSARLLDEDHPAHARGRRTGRAARRFMDRLDLAERRAAGRLAATSGLPGASNRAERRAALYAHVVSEPLDLDQVAESPPPRRTCTEPRTANAPPHTVRAFAA